MGPESRHPAAFLRRTLLIVLLPTCIGADAPRSMNRHLHLIFPGENWPDSAPSVSGERWIALRNDAGHSSLVEVTVSLSKSRPRAMRPVFVKVDQGFVPRFMIRGIAGVQPGSATTQFDGLLPLVKGMSVHFREPGRNLRMIQLSTVP